MIDKTNKGEMRPALAALYIVVGFILVGLADFNSGLEIRVYPLYFLPLSLAAWRFGRIGAILGTVSATAIWVLSNRAAGLQYSTGVIWIVNTVAQAIAFGVFSALLSRMRTLLNNEKALSRTDNLTGMANARAFYSSVELAVAACRRNKRPLTLAFIDLDNFKCVNDSYGHQRGDELLCDVANVLKIAFRATDSAARIGGDEFVVCLPETSESQARPLLERLRAALAVVYPTYECGISASIGALSWDVPPDDADAMITAADKIMYEIKKSGKNRVEIVSMPTG